MPELPEVETVVRSLEKRIKNKKIKDIDIRYKRIVNESPKVFLNTLKGESFRQFKRRGKYLLFYMDNIILVSHLRMEGKYSIVKDNAKPTKHTHVIFYLNDGSELRYLDTRKFGRFELFPLETDLKTFKNLGPEPFSKDLNLNYVKEYVKHKSIPVKQLLLDQSFIAGIGNIYADEILFKAKVNPNIKSNRLKDEDIKNIISSTRSILNSAIKAGGTTIRSFSSINHITGRFQQRLKVHTKSVCNKCNSKIKVVRINGRSTYFCPKCQKVHK